MRITILALVLLTLYQIVNASIGNENNQYIECLKVCSKKSCSPKSKNNGLKKFEEEQTLHMRLLGWTCLEEAIRL
jgi:hypothetical protein